MAVPWLEILDDTIRACATAQQPELAHQLGIRRAQLADPKMRVLVTGEANQGKSQLVNALVNAPVCAVGDDLTTAATAIVEHAPVPTAALVTGDAVPELRAIEARDPAPIDSVTARANQAARRGRELVRSEIGLPRTLLASGLVLIDTPAVDGAGNQVSSLPYADAVLVVSDATRELTASELDLLTAVAGLCPAIALVLTKIDLVPEWRAVADANRGHLARVGIPAPIIPVSAGLRLAAGKTGDQVLNEESGFGGLVGWLHRDVVSQADALGRRSVATLSSTVVEQLITPLHAEFVACQQADTGEAMTRWQAAGRRLEELQRESARWQTVLADEVADLVSDVEYDLRDRTRKILREADEYFDAADPAKDWTEFQEWLQDNLSSVAETNFAWQLDRFDWIAEELARQVDSALPGEVVPGTEPPLAASAAKMPKVERFGIAQKLFVGMRGSYGGLLMFGLATTLAGMPLINPISLGAGAAFGAKSVLEERGSRLKRRQSVAKTAAQRHVDDFFLSYGKESKDAARSIHRVLRDHFSGLAQQRRLEITESAKAIKRTIDADAQQRAQRAQELRRGLEQLGALRQRIAALGTVRGGIAAA